MTLARTNQPVREWDPWSPRVDSVWPPKLSENVEAELNRLCASFGFPPREPFKWSPGPQLWMRTELTGEARQEFFIKAFEVVICAGARAIVVVEDTSAKPATGAARHEQDVTKLLLERVDEHFQGARSDGIVIVDRPGGDRQSEAAFLLESLDMLECGTDYVKPQRIALNVLAVNSHLTRLLQMADVITSVTTATVGGESTRAKFAC